MFQNNLKIAVRHIRKNWGSSLMNIIGLTLGVIGSIIIFLTVIYETSFDTFHQNTSEIYRVTNDYKYPTFTMHIGQTPDPMAEALKTDFPEFTRVAPIASNYNQTISVGQQNFESDIIYCGSEFIEMFDFFNQPNQWIIGNPETILDEVNKTVLTKSTADRIFGSTANAMGEIITLSNEKQVEVAGIIQDPPNNSSYPFEQLVSYPTYDIRNTFGGVSATTTFVQIPTSVQVENLWPAIDKFNEKYMVPEWGEDFVTMDLQALSQIHFDERYGSNNYTASHSYLITLGLIGLLMILIACINFVNLATAKAISRSKEIGMRKILGSTKKDVISQFMMESFVLSSLAIVLGITIAQMFFPTFSELTNLNIGNNFSFTPQLLGFSLGLLALITLAIGLYPSILLSKFKPLDVVGQKFKSSSIKGFNLRRVLLTFQLTTSQALVIGAIVIACQISFFQNKDLGFKHDSILVLDLPDSTENNEYQTLKNKIQRLPFVEKASLNSSVPMTGNVSTTGLTSRDSEIQERFNVQFIFADNDYLPTMNFELLAGKSSINKIEEDTVRGFVVNETLINRLAFGSPENSIGKHINVHGYDAPIIGVVKNFHTFSLHNEIRPVAIIYGQEDYGFLALKCRDENIKQSINELESIYASVFPNSNMDYFFQDEHMGDMYESEITFSRLIQILTIISIVIAYIGLIGLSAFSSVKRFKEIGVRKVLGATVPNILFLMSKEFVVLSIVSFFISIPLAYTFVSGWLEGFAYRIDMEIWMLLVSGALALLITIFTVSMQSLKAAMTNPIISLKTE